MINEFVCKEKKISNIAIAFSNGHMISSMFRLLLLFFHYTVKFTPEIFESAI